jgi:hypothetical protein
LEISQRTRDSHSAHIDHVLLERRREERKNEEQISSNQLSTKSDQSQFKDGPKNAPALLTQISDAFQGNWDTYDALWTKGKVERA